MTKGIGDKNHRPSDRRVSKLLLPVKIPRYAANQPISTAKPFLSPQERRELARIKQQMKQIEFNQMKPATLQRLSRKLGITDEIIKKLTDKSLKSLTNEELARFVKMFLRRETYHIYKDAPYWIKNLDREELTSTQKAGEALTKLGIPHEKILESFPAGGRFVVLTEKTGETVESMFTELITGGKYSLPENLVKDFIKVISNMNAHGIVYNHLHLTNVVVVNGKIGLIDLKKAIVHDSIDWDNINDVGNKLGYDLAGVAQFLFITIRDIDRRVDLFGEFIDKYPLTGQQKFELFNRYLSYVKNAT